MSQQGFNPFAAPVQDQKKKAPQMQGIQAPNVAMQEQPGLVQTLAPTIASKALGSKAVSGALSSVPAAATAALGPFGIPILIGAGLLAARSGK